MNNNDSMGPSFPIVLSDQKNVLVSYGGEPAPGTCAPFRLEKGPHIRGRLVMRASLLIE